VDRGAAVWHHPRMPRRKDPQLPFRFARPGRRRGGLDEEACEELLGRLRADAARVAERFKIRKPFRLDADRPDARSRYGICHDDGLILVRLVNVRTGKPLKYSALVDTVVHELSHLRYMDHGQRWESLYDRMLAWARAEGIYEPRPVAPPWPPSQPEPEARPSPQLVLPMAGPRRKNGG
jgi:hypothetical protein